MDNEQNEQIKGDTQGRVEMSRININVDFYMYFIW